MNIFVAEENDGRYKLKENHSYYHQIQGQLYMTQKYCADLIIWTPSDMIVIRIVKNPEWLKNLEKLEKFFYDEFLNLLI